MGDVAESELAVVIDPTHGPAEARGATIGGDQLLFNE